MSFARPAIQRLRMNLEPHVLLHVALGADRPASRGSCSPSASPSSRDLCSQAARTMMPGSCMLLFLCSEANFSFVWRHLRSLFVRKKKEHQSQSPTCFAISSQRLVTSSAFCLSQVPSFRRASDCNCLSRCSSCKACRCFGDF